MCSLWLELAIATLPHKQVGIDIGIGIGIGIVIGIDIQI